MTKLLRNEETLLRTDALINAFLEFKSKASHPKGFRTKLSYSLSEWLMDYYANYAFTCQNPTERSPQTVYRNVSSSM